MKRSVLVVAHDAGGANQLFYGCMALRRRFDFNFYLAGPAKKLWVDSPQPGKLIHEWIECDCVLTGTGWQTEFERRAIATSREQSTPVASYLDYWANYRERFLEPEGQLLLPDQLWVPDGEALAVARKELGPGLPSVRIVGNQYWHQIRQQVRRLPKPSATSLLIALEPIRLSGINVGVLLQRVVDWVGFHFDKETQITLRPHPSGKAHDAEWLSEQLSDRFKVTTSSVSLAEDLAACTDILGFQSSVLPLGLSCGKRAWSFYPIEMLPPLLPHSGIDYLTQPF